MKFIRIAAAFAFLVLSFGVSGLGGLIKNPDTALVA